MSKPDPPLLQDADNPHPLPVFTDHDGGAHVQVELLCEALPCHGPRGGPEEDAVLQLQDSGYRPGSMP